MLVTSIPFAAFTAVAADGDAKDKYLFAYFTGNSKEGQRVRFAVSEDGYNYSALNANAPIITQNQGTKCARDPYILQGQDGVYYLICTDMDASGNIWWDNTNSFVIWKSTDLINWTDETIIDVSAITGTAVHRAWAPQIIWSEADNKYMVYFGLAADGYKSGTTMHYMLTDDLLNQSSYSKPVAMIDTSGDSIDGDIWYDDNGTYYLYYKDESNATICYGTSTTITGPYIYKDRLFSEDSGVPGLEGCNGFKKADGSFVMLADAYGDGYFVVADSNNGSYTDFTVKTSADYKINHLSPRHGAVINITTAQYDALVAAYGASAYGIEECYYWTPGTAYELAADGNYKYFNDYVDPSGSEAAGIKNWWGSVNISGGYARLVDSNLFLETANTKQILRGSEFSVKFSHKLTDSAKAETTMIAVSAGNDGDYIVVTNEGKLIVNDVTASTTANVVLNQESNYVLSYNSTKVTLYQNGTAVASVDASINVAQTGTLYLGLGYTDKTDAAGRTSADYGQVEISSESIEGEVNDFELKAIMEKFENMLAGGLYTNMGNAYAAYVQCQKAYDAYHFGGDESVDLTAAATDLRVAMLSMVKWSQPTASKVPSFQDDSSAISSDYYHNILYFNRPDNTYSTAGVEGNSNQRFLFQVGYYDSVLMYDGTQPKLPVMYVCRIWGKAAASTNRNPMSCYPTTGASATDDYSNLYLVDYWKGGDSKNWNYMSTINNSYTFGYNSRVTKAGKQLTRSWGVTTNSDYNAYANVLAFDTNYNWNGSYIASFEKMWWINYSGDNNAGDILRAQSSSSVYVINYKALLDKINEAKVLSANITDYGEGGLSAYFTALDEALNFDPNTYFTSSNEYQACANEISRIVDLFPSSATANSQAYQDLRDAITDYRNVTAPACINTDVQTAYTDALAAAQAAMKAVYKADKSATYSTDSNAIQALADTLTTKAETYKNSTHAYKWNRDEADKAIFACTNCGDEYSVDIQNYNTVAMIYDTLDSAKYTSDAWTVITDQKAEFDRIKNDRHIDPYTQEVVDRVVRLLLSAINNPLGGDKDKENNKFIITHKVVLDNVEISSIDIPGTYGATTPISYTGPGTVTSWDVKVADSSIKTVATDESTYVLLVQDNTIITTYVRSENTATYVNIVDQYGKVLYSIPASEGDAIVCEGNLVKVGENEPVTVPNMPYMNVTGFRINGTVSNSDTVKAGENKINPIYTPVDGSYTITADGAAVTVNGAEGTTAKYDNTVTVTFSEGTYAVAIQNSDGSYAVVAYGNEYTFFANRNMTFYAVNGADSNYTIGDTAVTNSLMIHRLDYTLPFAYNEVSLTDSATNKYTTFCAYSTNVPEGVTVLEKGTIFTKNTALTDDTFVIGGDGVLQNVNTNTAGSGNQYSLSIKNSAGVKSRAYVKYTYTYDGREITAISYGNISTAE